MYDELFPVLATEDLPRALPFYRDLLDGAARRDPGPGEPDLDVLVVDDTRLYAETLTRRLARCPGIGVVEAGMGIGETLRLLLGRPFDVVVLNAAAADSRAVLDLLAGTVPVIALGLRGLDERMVGYVDAGAGHLPPQGSVDDLVRMLRRVAGRGRGRLKVAAVPRLTSRESQVLALIATGRSNRDIAVRLGIQVRTVTNHVHSILGKLGVGRRGEAVARMRHILEAA